MTTIKPTFDQKIDNLQHQLDTMNRDDAAFKGYVQPQLEIIATEMVTKDDLYSMEARICLKMATKDSLHDLEARMDAKLDKMADTLAKVADKVGVST